MPKIGLLITTFNRPEYLRQCLESVRRSDIPEGSTIMIVDDASTDPETKISIDLFVYPGVNICKAYKNTNRSIKDSLINGIDYLFKVCGCDFVCNLDGDAIVRKDFLYVLLNLKERFPENIVTGFNCLTKNKNGTERHIVVESGDGYNKKKSVGGLNMFFDSLDYTQYIRPALTKTLSEGGNWDHAACLLAAARGLDIVCAVPSVCNHIGINSSMGHSAGGEPPDVATDFFYSHSPEIYEWHSGPRINLLKVFNEVSEAIQDHDLYNRSVYKHDLRSVTLVGADCVDINRLIKAADICCQDIQFGSVKLFSSIQSDDPRVIGIESLNSKEDYSHFMMKELSKHIETDYILVIQHDGYVINADAWKPEWLQFDYLGACWEWYPNDGRQRVGNGGFSLRSAKLHKILSEDDRFIPVNEPGVNLHKEEDHCICRVYGNILEQEYGIKFAPVEEARNFSIESWRNPVPVYRGQFGFHGGNIVFPQSVINKPY